MSFYKIRVKSLLRENRKVYGRRSGKPSRRPWMSLKHPRKRMRDE